MGVRRAMDTVLTTLKKEKRPICTFGPLIHNRQVLDLLERKGITIEKDVSRIKGGTVVIRAHGIPPAQKQEILNTGAKVVDGTCLRVVKVQTIIRRYARRGYQVLIVGDQGHPEVLGLLGFAEGRGILITSKNDIDGLPQLTRYIVVAQTTQDEKLFQEIVSEILARFPDGEIFNTICHSTHDRQAEISSLCRQVEAIIVVGGRDSANTKRLAQIATEAGIPAYHIETEQDLDLKEISKYSRVAVTAGASTPNWIINGVVSRLEAIKGEHENSINSAIYRISRFLLESNIYASLGAGFLTYASLKLQGLASILNYFLIAGTYIYAAHNLNHLTDKETDSFSDPGRAMFFAEHERIILFLSLTAMAFSLFLSYFLGWFPFFFLLFSSVIGALYGVEIIPDSILLRVPFRRLKDIPGSKTLFIALAWSAVAALIPAWGLGRIIFNPQMLVSFLFVFAFVYIRSALTEIFDIQADRLVGKETLPIMLGEKSTIAILKGLTVFLICLLLGAPLLGYATGVSFWLTMPVLSLAGCLWLFEKKYLRRSVKSEILIESNFILAGLVSFIWAHF